LQQLPVYGKAPGLATPEISRSRQSLRQQFSSTATPIIVEISIAIGRTFWGPRLEAFVVSSIMRSTGVRMTLASLFRAAQKSLGISITPSHFYFPVPKMESFDGKDWRACRPCPAFDFGLPEQIQRLQTDLLPYAAECEFPERPVAGNGHFHFNNGYFERVDAEVAWSFVRRGKPRRVVEVGSGNTTLILAAAVRQNAREGSPAEMISIEPHPAPFLKEGIPGLARLIEKPVQEVPLDRFRSLECGDLLFIDSTHVVTMDNDVLYECLRILPELAPGVLVHFHDIFTPLDYPEKFVRTNLCFWSEQYLLEAFLSFNPAFKVVWAASAMQQFHSDVIREAFPEWQGSFARMPDELKVFTPTLDGINVWPCSFWITRTAAAQPNGAKPMPANGRSGRG
ncbi:MAG: class I SAM-dependent methyltransferase, partial [Acidobacteriaceae bacterium]